MQNVSPLLHANIRSYQYPHDNAALSISSSVALAAGVYIVQAGEQLQLITALNGLPYKIRPLNVLSRGSVTLHHRTMKSLKYRTRSFRGIMMWRLGEES